MKCAAATRARVFSRRHIGLLVLALSALTLTLSACDDELLDSPVAVKRAAAPALATGPTPATTHARYADVEELDAATLFQHMRERGKRGTVVNVWASWCGSCREEIPLLVDLEKAMAAEGIDFVFVSADEVKDYPKAVELMRTLSGPLPVLTVPGSMAQFKRAMHPDWKGAIPATFLFDQQQKLRHFWEGPVFEHEIAPILQGFLAGEPIDGVTRVDVAQDAKQ